MNIRKINQLDFSKIDRKTQVEILRQFREEECYHYVNRGVLWYNKLTEQQKSEFAKWYQEWLDVTETLIMPTKPRWLK